MIENELYEQVEKTAELLYQNKEIEGITETAKLMEKFQKIIQDMTEAQSDAAGTFALLMMKELIESYEHQDVIGMADCLMQKATLLLRFISQTCE